MPLAPGSTLGPYCIRSALGTGGMGEVYRATDSRLGRDVAIKILPSELASNPDRRARFEREARTVASLNHPNIVVLYAIEEAEGTPFLTMELVEGRSLDHHIGPGGLPVTQALEIASALTEALVAAHAHGIVHRDVKPANVMITRDGRIKMLDFGLAKQVAAEVPAVWDEALTAAAPLSGIGQILGTVPYMSPEQVRGDVVDARSDLFSLGVMLYELLSGTRPFAGATLADLGASILRDTPTALLDIRPELPRELERVVNWCLRKGAGDRVQTAKELRTALEAVRRSVESSERVPPSDVVPSQLLDREVDLPSIAVLPFVNRSRDEEDEFFADGLADELLSVLAKIRGLRVAARTSSFRFKGVHDDTAVIGEKLNVATILEGSLRKSGNRVRISVQLVKARDGYQLWSETYDRTLDDIFAVQDDIAQSVVRELRATLLGEVSGSGASGEVRAEVAEAARGRGRDTESYRLTLQGSFLTMRAGGNDIEQATGYLSRAIELEPDNPSAWAWLSVAQALTATTGRGELHQHMRRARASAQRALTLEPNLAQAHMAMGLVQQWYDFDWGGAEVSLRKAAALAPGAANAQHALGILSLIRGRFEDGEAFCRRAVELDPLSVPAHRFLAHSLAALGRLEESEAAIAKALELSPEALGLRGYLAMLMLQRGRTADALAVATSEPARYARLMATAAAHYACGHRTESDEALQRLIEDHGDDGAFQIAEVHSFRGNHDAAFEWLDRAYLQRDPGLVTMKRDFYLRALHSDRRWDALLRKMRLEL
jgi:eukaryotic-like serine/threonine-protein kinase